MIERPSPEMLAEARRTFDEAEYLAGLREIESGGGFRLEDFSDEIDRICHEKGQEKVSGTVSHFGSGM